MVSEVSVLEHLVEFGTVLRHTIMARNAWGIVHLMITEKQTYRQEVVEASILFSRAIPQ
jgi:hypothetical protein